MVQIDKQCVDIHVHSSGMDRQFHNITDKKTNPKVRHRMGLLQTSLTIVLFDWQVLHYPIYMYMYVHYYVVVTLYHALSFITFL